MEKGRIMAYIKVENLKYRYPNTTKLALDGLDFEIEKGSFFRDFSKGLMEEKF